MSTVSTPASPAGPLDGFVDDGSALLPDAPGSVHDVTAGAGEAGPLAGAVVVRDTDLPLLRGSTAPLAVVVTGGAGQVSGPVDLAARLGLRLTRLHVVLRDPGDLVGNARRVVAAVDDALDAGLDEEVAVHVEVPDGTGAEGPSSSWLAAVDELAAAELGLALPLAEPWAGPDGTPVAAARFTGWVDAALDRETPFVVLGARSALTAGRRGATTGALDALVATRLVLDGDADAVRVLEEQDAGALLGRTSPEALARARRWCTGAVVVDPGGAGPVRDELAAALAGWVR